MLFTKKIRFSVNEKQLKEELTSKDGAPLLRMNLRYPEITCPRRDPLLRSAVPFYRNFAEGFAEYARTELKAAAERAFSQSDVFDPFSAVMRYEKTLENDAHISFLIDISVSNGTDAPVTERKTQVWSRRDGTLCRIYDFIDKKHLEEQLSGMNIKKADKSLYVLRDTGIELFVRENGTYRGVAIEI